MRVSLSDIFIVAEMMQVEPELGSRQREAAEEIKGSHACNASTLSETALNGR